MNLQAVFCPNKACRDKHKVGYGNIVSHGIKRRRCKCTRCGKTFSYRRGTMFLGLHYPEQLVLWVVSLVAWGCPVAAIVAVFEVDERTVAAWLRRAGEQAVVFHHQQVRRLDLQQVQVDELRVKVQGGVAWVAMALAVGSRLWLGAVTSVQRDKRLAQQLMTGVYNWAQRLPLVISFDGWTVYPGVCRRLFREPQLTGKVGQPRLVPWAQLTLVQVVKHQPQQWRVRRWVLAGSCTMLRYLLNVTQGTETTINTAYIERLFGTFRAHLAPLTRRTRCPARHVDTINGRVFLVGCLYNFCCLHHSLPDCTPAMAAGLSDHCWSLTQFFWWRPRPYWASTV